MTNSGLTARLPPDFVRTIVKERWLLPDGVPTPRELPLSAWQDNELLVDCPHCGQPLRFNPFLVDNLEVWSARPRPSEQASTITSGSDKALGRFADGDQVILVFEMDFRARTRVIELLAEAGFEATKYQRDYLWVKAKSASELPKILEAIGPFREDCYYIGERDPRE